MSEFNYELHNPRLYGLPLERNVTSKVFQVDALRHYDDTFFSGTLQLKQNLVL